MREQDECIGVVGNFPVMRCTTLKASGGRVEGLLAYYAGLAEDRARPCRNGRGFGASSARGFDATFSAPKSVSVLCE